MNVLKIDGLTKRFGDLTAVDGISFTVGKGELVGFLGVNGAGKSTTINILSTLLKPDGGSAVICGAELGRQDDLIRRRTGMVYQQNCLDDELTVRENLVCRGTVNGTPPSQMKARLAQVSQVLSLSDLLPRRYGKLSGGQKRRCEIAAALLHAPELLFLDEPTTGLDPATRRDVWAAVEQLRRDTGMTVLLTTHYMEEAAGANRIVIIDKGRIRAEGTPFELKEHYAVDTVRLYCEDAQTVAGKTRAMGLEPALIDGGVSLSVAKTLDALAIVNAVRDDITGFEVIQGRMDDVFLRVCGRSLEED